jgi:hypothetical protein
MSKISRNAPCPCGSGKKYKKCCFNKVIAPQLQGDGKIIEQLSKLKANETLSIEDTIGTGLATLLAKNLNLSDIDLPEKEKRQDIDIEVLPKLISLLGSDIQVMSVPDGSIKFKTKNGIIILEP